MSHLLTELTDTMVNDFDIADLLTTLADRCAEVLDIDAAGIMLVAPHGALELMACSKGAEPVVALLEHQTDEGPCVECACTGRAVVDHDLAADEAQRAWPTFAAAACRAGFRSADAIPMRLRNQSIGVLTLLRRDPTPLTDESVAVAQTVADLATVAVLQQDAARQGVEAVEKQLSRALHDRIVIEQAKGMVAERDGVDVDEAFARMRNRARLDQHRLVDVAADIVDGTLNPAELAPATRPI